MAMKTSFSALHFLKKLKKKHLRDGKILGMNKKSFRNQVKMS